MPSRRTYCRDSDSSTAQLSREKYQIKWNKIKKSFNLFTALLFSVSSLLVLFFFVNWNANLETWVIYSILCAQFIHELKSKWKAKHLRKCAYERDQNLWETSDVDAMNRNSTSFFFAFYVLARVNFKSFRSSSSFHFEFCDSLQISCLQVVQNKLQHWIEEIFHSVMDSWGYVHIKLSSTLNSSQI